MTAKTDVGLIGLAVMGRNLALNLADNGYAVTVNNRTTSKIDDFLEEEGTAAGIQGAWSLADLVGALASPRRIIVMVQAGAAVDAVIDALVPLLDQGDIIIDGGNSKFTDTIRRTAELEEKGLLFLGVGISGGEEGARYGPSIMPGGSAEAWPHVRDMLQAVAAKVADGTPCCDWVGADGAGHSVKMVHNGIEYGDMQVLAEAYHLMSLGLGMSADEIAAVFRTWKKGPLDSYLTDITAEILAAKDEDGEPLVEKILDTASQKGTGMWTAMSSLELGVPVTLVSEAVFARILSSFKNERVAASHVLAGPEPSIAGERAEVLADIHDALYASKITSYAQGFTLLRAAGAEYGWNLNFGRIAYLWREGCIIRSVLLEPIKAAFDREPMLASLLIDPHFRDELARTEGSWRRTVARAATAGIPIPAYSSALSYYDGYRTERLPANLIQAQRDYFGAHTYERVDRARGEMFHTDWISLSTPDQS